MSVKIQNFSWFYAKNYGATSSIWTVKAENATEGSDTDSKLVVCNDCGATLEDAQNQAAEISRLAERPVTLLFNPLSETKDQHGLSVLARGAIARDLVSIVDNETKLRSGWADISHENIVNLFAFGASVKFAKAALKVTKEGLRPLIHLYAFDGEKQIPHYFAGRVINFVTKDTGSLDSSHIVQRLESLSDLSGVVPYLKG